MNKVHTTEECLRECDLYDCARCFHGTYPDVSVFVYLYCIHIVLEKLAVTYCVLFAIIESPCVTALFSASAERRESFPTAIVSSEGSFPV